MRFSPIPLLMVRAGSATGAVERTTGPRKVVPRTALDLGGPVDPEGDDGEKSPLSVLLDDEEALVRARYVDLEAGFSTVC